jgi:hypothetical protein
VEGGERHRSTSFSDPQCWLWSGAVTLMKPKTAFRVRGNLMESVGIKGGISS